MTNWYDAPASPSRTREREHERSEDVARPDDPVSFGAMCRAVGQGNRLLRLQRGMLKHSIRLAGQAEDQGEDR